MTVMSTNRPLVSLPSLYDSLPDAADHGQADGSQDDTVWLDPDRRRANRRACSLYARCREVCLLPRQSRLGRVRDLSVEGLGLLLSQPYRPGTVLGVAFVNAEGRVQGRARVRVEHATWLPDDHCWLVGCKAVG